MVTDTLKRTWCHRTVTTLT